MAAAARIHQHRCCVALGILDPKRSSAAICRSMRTGPRRGGARCDQAPRPRLEEAAAGIIAIANANMIQAIRTLSVERGHDIRGFSLLAFGGAGPIIRLIWRGSSAWPR